jgi:hypothetical protein
MFGFKGKYGLSFSLSRFIGLVGAKNSITSKTGIPKTRGGLERKIGRKIINLFF